MARSWSSRAWWTRRFAVEVQLSLRDENANRPLERQYCYRIGINIGDIVNEPEDIYGDGVNIAVRLQELADPGGICVSGTGSIRSGASST